MDHGDQAGMVCRVEVEEPGRAVTRAVVHDDDLFADALHEEGRQALVKVRAAVVRRHHDADVDPSITLRIHRSPLCDAEGVKHRPSATTRRMSLSSGPCLGP